MSVQDSHDDRVVRRRQQMAHGTGGSAGPLAGFVMLTGFALLLVAFLSSSLVLAQEVGFSDLRGDQRVYDLTSDSLSTDDTADLRDRLAGLGSVDANTILYVRALDATPEETLDQVEALQQAWVAATGADQSTAVAMLINRNPDDPTDARAGIFVGQTFNDGNVPEEEQLAIVDEALIPPLRDGDVHASLVAGLDRLEDSIRNGPPVSAFAEWSADAGGSWLPWLGVGLAVAGLAACLALFGRRERTGLAELPATTTRPTDLHPALGGALAKGGPQASAVPATLLDLAARGGIDIEPESEGGTFSTPKVQLRLRDHEAVVGPIDSAMWSELLKRADTDVVSSKGLTQLSTDSKQVRKAVEAELEQRGWWDSRAGAVKGWLIAIFIVAISLAGFSQAVAIAGRQMLMIVGIVALVALAVTALIMVIRYSRLPRAGQEAAIGWEAYHDGLKAAAKDETVPLDLDTVLADAVAMNLGAALKDRLEDANEAGVSLRAFTSSPADDPDSAVMFAATFPWWTAFSSSVATSSGSGAVSGAGAGGGGGAAGST